VLALDIRPPALTPGGKVEFVKLDLTQRQKELFEKYKGNFTVTPPSIALNEGFDRINDGVYR
jgi:photosystem II PsbU protein